MYFVVPIVHVATLAALRHRRRYARAGALTRAGSPPSKNISRTITINPLSQPLTSVDDLLIAGSDSADIVATNRELVERFEMKDIGEAKVGLGL